MTRMGENWCRWYLCAPHDNVKKNFFLLFLRWNIFQVQKKERNRTREKEEHQSKISWCFSFQIRLTNFFLIRRVKCLENRNLIELCKHRSTLSLVKKSMFEFKVNTNRCYSSCLQESIVFSMIIKMWNEQNRVPFVFLVFAIILVYGTLIVVYLFRNRLFKRSVDRSTIKHQKSFPDRYFLINRCLHRLKAN